MIIVETVAELQSHIQQEKNAGQSIGFVPTMGALHLGHLSLVEQCRDENDYCVVSIFVNPTQFNNTSDLTHYPRTMQADCDMLAAAGVDIVFAPTVEEVYPEEDTRTFDFGQLDKVMEGEHRPGHFNGVAQVVSKLFTMTTPDKAYFGQKDFQQLAIIKAMVAQLEMPVEIISCPIVREADGLAMSSRNTRLEEAHRHIAPLISKTLLATKEMYKDKSIKDVKDFVVNAINAEKLLNVEYFDIADTLTLQSSKSWKEAGDKVACIAVFAGDIRLIDNITY